MVLHGPHHSAQKSTMTGLSDPATVSSKVEVDRLTIPAMVAASFVGLVRRAKCTGGATGADRRGIPAVDRTYCSMHGVSGVVLEPALGVDGGHAARAGGGDRLAVGVVLDVAAGEDALDVRRRRARAAVTR